MSIQSEINRISANVSDAFDAIAAKGVIVPSDSKSDDLADLIGQIQQGGGSAIVVTEELDSHGGIIKNITAVDLGEDTVDAAHLLQGYTAHDRLGRSVTGVYVPSASSLQAKTNVNPSATSQTITADAGYDGLSSVQINGIDPDYIGSNVTRRTSSDVTVSGATVTAPAGYYASSASKTVASGTVGTPTATKGSVSNHSVTVTPSVTNASGYITGGTKSGTAVTVSASELVSGSQTITSNGQTDVTNLASVTVAIPIVTYYTGSSAPASSLGQDGDIYLQS